MTDAINAKRDVLGDRELDAVSGGTMMDMLNQAIHAFQIATDPGGGPVQVDGPTKLFQETLNQVSKNAG
jgi:hypothetical protein